MFTMKIYDKKLLCFLLVKLLPVIQKRHLVIKLSLYTNGQLTEEEIKLCRKYKQEYSISIVVKILKINQ